MVMKNLVWLILPGAPDEFFDGLKEAKTDEQFLEYLIHAEKSGWVNILGNTDKHPKDIVAVLQEHFTVKHISMGEKDARD